MYSTEYTCGMYTCLQYIEINTSHVYILQHLHKNSISYWRVKAVLSISLQPASYCTKRSSALQTELYVFTSSGIIHMTSIRNQTNGPLFQDAKGPTYVSQSNLTSALACKLTFVLLRKLTLLQANWRRISQKNSWAWPRGMTAISSSFCTVLQYRRFGGLVETGESPCRYRSPVPGSNLDPGEASPLCGLVGGRSHCITTVYNKCIKTLGLGGL